MGKFFLHLPFLSGYTRLIIQSSGVDFIKVGRAAHGAGREFNFGRGANSEAFFGAERMAQKLQAQSAIDKNFFIKVGRVAHGA